MSPVSNRVLAIGFKTHKNAAKMIRTTFSGSADIRFVFQPLELGEICACDAIILGEDFSFDSESDFEVIRQAVQKGTNLIILGIPEAGLTHNWQELAGATPLNSKPEGEWFLKIQGSSLLTQRLPMEFAAVGTLTPLKLHDGSEPILSATVAFSDQIAAAIKRFPDSTICTIGFRPTSSHSSAHLMAVIRRSATTVTRRSDWKASAPLGVGIIGYGAGGGMGNYHSRAVSEVAGLDLVAVADSDPQRRAAAEAEFPNVHTYRTTEDLAQDSRVGIVIIATPPVSHTGIALAMLDAGKHVIAEKPMCLTSKDAQQLIAKAKAVDRMLSVNQNRRWDRDFRAIAQAVADGKIGELFNIETFVGGFEHPCRAWHSEESVSGGAVFDWGSHHIDWIIQLYGSAPVKVSATQHKRVWHDVTNVDQVRVHMIWEDGREAEFFQSDIAAIRKPKYFIQGSFGTIIGNYRPIIEEKVSLPLGYQEHEYHHAEAPATMKLSRYESECGLIEESLPLAKPQQFAFHNNVANHLLLGEPLAVKPESAAEVIAVLEAAQLSSTTNSEYVPLSEVSC